MSCAPDFDDEIVAGTCVVRDGEVVHGPTADARCEGSGVTHGSMAIAGCTGILEFITIFVLAAFVGYEVISKVPSILHTPLMSGSNAIHGIILVGTMLVLGRGPRRRPDDPRLPGRASWPP